MFASLVHSTFLLCGLSVAVTLSYFLGVAALHGALSDQWDRGVNARPAFSAFAASWQPCHATKSSERTSDGTAGYGVTGL